MDPILIGTVIAALCSLGAAVYTAKQGRATAQESAAAADREVQRKMQVDLVTSLAEQVRELNGRVTELRSRLTATEGELDAERARRRELERTLDRLTDLVGQLDFLLSRFPTVLTDPEVARIIAAVQAPPQS